MRRVWSAGLLATAAIAATALGCSHSSDSNSGGVARYLLTSTCTADISFIAANEISVDRLDVPSGWDFMFAADEGDSLFISATLDCDGTVTVDIFKDGLKVKTDTASGLNATATAERRF
ncbi:MAG: hypothetical protein U0V87_09845 [Acidobacteriota bacterium]